MTDYFGRRFGTSLQISLHDKDNGTYRGSILLKNWTAWYGPETNYDDTTDLLTPSRNATTTDLFDPLGASYYVIAVILVYGMSIVALIASHIKRKKKKLVEDKQINKYLREFQTVKEESSRESYKNLKKKIKEQINWDKQTKSHHSLHHNLSQALLPMLAVGVTLPKRQRTSSVSSTSFQGSRTSLAVHSRSGSLGQINVSQPRSRTDSAGSNNNVSTTMLGVSTGETTLAKHDRKRGLANLFVSSNNEPHLEKILEESLDSRASFFKRKNSKRSLQSTVDSIVSSHDITKDLKTLSADLSESRYERKPSDTPSVQDSSTFSISDHSVLGEDVLAGPSSLPYLVVPTIQHIDTTEEVEESDDVADYPFTPGSLSDSPVSSSGRPIFTLTVPTSTQFQPVEPIWIPCSEEVSLATSSYNNNCFRHSPSPAKSRGASPRFSKDHCVEVMHDSSSDDSDLETKQLLHITCV